jgi:hypothetical protein
MFTRERKEHPRIIKDVREGHGHRIIMEKVDGESRIRKRSRSGL